MFLGIKQLLSIFPNSPTMKFNTALLFFLSGLAIYLFKHKLIFFQKMYLFIVGVILFISFFTVVGYFFTLPFLLDNFFIQDNYSIMNSGKMSLGTAFSFSLIGIGFITLSINKQQAKLISQISFITVLLIAFLGIITYLLAIPGENKTIFFETMAIHTSVLFLVISMYLVLQTKRTGYLKFFFTDLSGSNFIRKSFLFIIIFPLALSYLLVFLITNNILKIDFGIIVYTIILIVVVLSYLSIIGKQNNKIDSKNLELSQTLTIKNQELRQYNEAINRVAIVVVVDIKGKMKWVNNHFCEVTQYSKEELIGNTFRMLDSNYHSKDYFKNLWSTILKGENWSGKIRNRAKDGSFYWVQTAIIPLKDQSEKVYEFMTIQEDITTIKEEAVILEKRNLSLEKRNRELEQFTYIASHDLQEPLRTITSFSELLYKTYPKESLNNTAKKSLVFIKQSTERMQILIKGLLDYARIGKKELPEEVDLGDVLNNVVKDLNTIINRTNTIITIGELPKVVGYPVSLRLLFQNIITNAIKFRRPDSISKIKIFVERKRGYWKFSIQDNGIGIAENQREKIFMIFQRLHLKDEYEGSGIGLAHCQKIVEIHNGEIWVDAAPEGGSIFHFTISDEIDSL